MLYGETSPIGCDWCPYYVMTRGFGRVSLKVVPVMLYELDAPPITFQITYGRRYRLYSRQKIPFMLHVYYVNVLKRTGNETEYNAQS
jgi:transposase